MKKTLVTITLAATLTFGSTFTYAGIMVSDRSGIIVGDKVAPCSDVKEGIIVGDFLTWLEGIIVGDRKAKEECMQIEGIMVSDRSGIIVGD